MAVNCGDFERFLYANYPDDYRRATADRVPEDVLTAIVSKHSAHYDKWRNIPEWIKNKYRDILPKDLLNGNVQVKDFVVKEEQGAKRDARESAMLVSFSVQLLAMGYAAETVQRLAENKKLREELLQKAQGREFSKEEKERWRGLRESDREAIIRDWQINQPEKYAFHLIKEMSKAQKQGKDIKGIEEELAMILPEFKAKDNKNKLVSYLRGQSQQAALSHLSPEVLDMFSNKLYEFGINITPQEGQLKKTNTIAEKSLAQSLKEHFLKKVQMEDIFCRQYRQSNTFDAGFDKVSVREVLSDEALNVLSFSKVKRTQRG